MTAPHMNRYFKWAAAVGLFALTVLALKAQDKGFISGTVQFRSSTTDQEGNGDPKASAFTFGPAVGYNLDPNNVVGLALGITYSRTVTPTMFNESNGIIHRDVTTKENSMEFAPFYRRVKSVGDKFLLYGQVKVGYGTGKITGELEGISNSESETKVSTLRAGVGPGIVFVPATRWALSADWGLLGYSSRTEKVDVNNNERKTVTSGFEAGLNPGAITLALNWLF